MLGYAAGTKMKLLKSMHGLSDAPRLWWEEATDRMLSCGFVIHPLDPCLFMSYRVDNNNNQDKKFDGAIGIHVDDMLGGGSNEKGEVCFASRVQELKKVFNFRTWEDTENGTLNLSGGGAMDFCGNQLSVKQEPQSPPVQPSQTVRRLPPCLGGHSGRRACR